MAKPDFLQPMWESHHERLLHSLVGLTQDLAGQLYDPPRQAMVAVFDRQLATTFYSFASITVDRDLEPWVDHLSAIKGITHADDLLPDLYDELIFMHRRQAVLLCDRHTRNAIDRDPLPVVWRETNRSKLISIAPRRVLELFNT